MLIRFLTTATCDCIVSRFQLNNHASEPLRERIMNIASHPISFFQNGCLPASLGKFIELNCQHRLVSERLRQFNLFRPIRWPVAVANPDESFNSPAHKGWNPQELLSSPRQQILAKICGNMGIMFYVFADRWHS